MKAPSLRSVLLGLALSLVILFGVLASLPLAAWLWWAVPPLELHYMDAYFRATMARRDLTALTSVDWVYKSAPNRRDEIANESDVIADSPGNVSDYRVPMHLSPDARKSGWSVLITGPRQMVKAAELEPYLRSQFYGGRSFWELLRPLLWGALLMVIVGWGIRDWIGSLERGRKMIPNEVRYLPQMQANSSLDQPPKGWRDREVIGTFRDLFQRLPKHSMKARNPTPEATSGQNPKPHLEALGSGVSRTAFEPGNQPALKAAQRALEEPSETVSQAGRSHFPSLPGIELGAKTERGASEHPRSSPKRHMIFPGEGGISGADQRPAEWDESQWID